MIYSALIILLNGNDSLEMKKVISFLKEYAIYPNTRDEIAKLVEMSIAESWKTLRIKVYENRKNLDGMDSNEKDRLAVGMSIGL